MAAPELAAEPLAGPPEALRTGALALAALEYWRRSSDAHVSLWGLGYMRRPTPEARCVLLSTAIEGVEALRELAETGHPRIRSRAADALPNLFTRLAAFVESRP